MAEDLKKRMEDAGVMDSIGNLQDIAEEMFVRFYMASGSAAEEKAKNIVLMQEAQRLEEANGKLRTELDNAMDKCWSAHEEVEKAKKSLDELIEKLEQLVQENRALSEKNSEMEGQMRRMVAKAATDNPSVSLEADSSLCTREPLEPVKCPKCGSVDVARDCFGRKGLCVCNVCAEMIEVD